MSKSEFLCLVCEYKCNGSISMPEIDSGKPDYRPNEITPMSYMLWLRQTCNRATGDETQKLESLGALTDTSRKQSASRITETRVHLAITWNLPG